MRIAWKNYIYDSILEASSALTNRQVDDLKLPHLSRSFSFDSHQGSIVIDLKTIKNITCFVLGGTNLNENGTYITLEGNNSDSWEEPGFKSDINYYENHQLLFLDQNYRYWRVSINADTVYVKIGHIFIGQYLQLPGINPDITIEHNRTDSLSMGMGMSPYGDRGDKFLACIFKFPDIKDYTIEINKKKIATRKEILEMWNYVGGIIPVYMCVWEEDLNKEPPIFGIINNSNKLKFKRNDKYKSYSTQIAFQETK